MEKTQDFYRWNKQDSVKRYLNRFFKKYPKNKERNFDIIYSRYHDQTYKVLSERHALSRARIRQIEYFNLKKAIKYFSTIQ